MCKCSKKLGGGEDHTHTHRAGGEARRGKTLEPEPQATRQTTMGGNNVEARYFADRACSASLHLWGSQSRRCYRYAHFTDEEMEAHRSKVPDPKHLQWEFPLWHSGLRTWLCCSCGLGRSCGLDSVPDLGTSICHGCGQPPPNIPPKPNNKEEAPA